MADPRSRPAAEASSVPKNNSAKADSILTLLSHLSGEVVTVSKKDGIVIEGMLDPDSLKAFKSSRTLILTLCCQLRPEQRVLSDKKIVLDLQNISMIKCDSFTVTNGRSIGFATDSSISSSGTHQPQKKEFHKWIPDSLPPDAVDLNDTSNTKWDQFAANEKLFGIRTGFNETEYTTGIDRSSIGFKDREARAERLAHEIQTSARSTANPHLREERTGVLLGDADEETMYGSVSRSSHPPGFADESDIVSLPSHFNKFEHDRLKIIKEFTAVQEELASESPIEVPQSIKSKLNPSAQEFVPSTSSDVVEYNEEYYEYPDYSNFQSSDGMYYYYDEYGNCYCYDPYYQY